MGLLIAWLRAAHDFGSQQAHIALTQLAANRHDERTSFQAREAARKWAESQPALTSLLALERARRPGEAPEPADRA